MFSFPGELPLYLPLSVLLGGGQYFFQACVVVFAFYGGSSEGVVFPVSSSFHFLGVFRLGY